MDSFQYRQKQLTDYLRDPASADAPPDISPRRLQVYSELFFNNFEGFLSSGFPVCRSLLDDEAWYALVRAFMRDHRCHSPYFLTIAEAFLHYLDTRQDDASLPVFFYELAHYEWVELALDIADVVLPERRAALGGLQGHQVLALSPLAWSLCYRFPVHRIGRQFQPEQPAEIPTFIVVYRNRQEQVQFLEVNAMSAQLLVLLDVEGGCPVEDALVKLAATSGMALESLSGFAVELIQQLYELDIVIIPEAENQQ